MENQEHTDIPTERRPLGFWLRAVDGLLTREFVTSLDDAGASRRDWMLLNAIDGSVDAPWLAERLARKSGRVRRLADRGWIVRTDDGWNLTESGRAEKERLATLVNGLRARVAGAVSPEDYATTMASLEAIARELGWDENAHDLGQGFRGGRGFGHGRGPDGGHGFGGERAFGGRRGFDPMGDHGGRRCGDRHPHGERHSHSRHDEHAYERGFTAGFERGRAAASEPAA